MWCVNVTYSAPFLGTCSRHQEAISMIVSVPARCRNRKTCFAAAVSLSNGDTLAVKRRNIILLGGYEVPVTLFKLVAESC